MWEEYFLSFSHPPSPKKEKLFSVFFLVNAFVIRKIGVHTKFYDTLTLAIQARSCIDRKPEESTSAFVC